MNPQPLNESTNPRKIDKAFVKNLPKGISRATTCSFLFGAVVFLNAVLVSFQQHRMVALGTSMLLVFWIVRLNFNLMKRTKWAFPVFAFFSIFMLMRYIMGISVWFLRHAKGINPETQLLVYYATCLLPCLGAVFSVFQLESRLWLAGKQAISTEESHPFNV